MDAEAAQQLLQDDGSYRLTPGGAPSHQTFKKWVADQQSALRELKRAKVSPRSSPALAEQARELMYSFQAYHLVYWSALLDTSVVEESYEPWEQAIRRFAKSPYSALEAYAGADARHREAVWDRARALARVESKGPLRSLIDRATSLLPPARSSLDELFVRIPYTGNRSVYFERDFAEDMVGRWSTPNLTSTSHAVEVLLILASRSDSPYAVDEKTLSFVARHEERRGFRPSLKKGLPLSLYAARSAIVIHKAAQGLKCEERLGSEKAAKSLGKARTDAVYRYAVDELDEILNLDDTDPSPHKLVDLHHALWLTWQLGNEPGSKESSVVKERAEPLRRFLEESYVESAGFSIPVLGGFPAFALAPGSRACCLTACAFAERVAAQCGLTDGKLKEQLASCEDFVFSCFHSTGGFACAPGEEPDLIHTFLGMRMNEALDWNFAEKIPRYEEKIQFLLTRCSKGGGHALIPDWKPSAYGTRLALQITELLGVPIPDSRAMREFILRLPQRNGGYAGYHAQRKGLPA